MIVKIVAVFFISSFMPKLEIWVIIFVPIRVRASLRSHLNAECISIVLACSDRPLVFAYARTVWYTLMDRLQNDPRCTLALNLLRDPRAASRGNSQDNAKPRDNANFEVFVTKYSWFSLKQLVYAPLYPFVFYKGGVLTSNARRDIAVAKNMQITIPANVRYLGPISSRAATKFTVQKSFAFRKRLDVSAYDHVCVQ